MFERFTKEARETVRGSVASAADRGEDRVGPGQLMLALADRADSTGARILADHGITRDALGGAGRQDGPAGLTDDEIAALRSVGVDTDAVFRRIEESFGPDALRPDPSARRSRKRGRLGGAFDAEARKVLELSLRECLALRHKAIGTGHILLALLRQGLPESMAAVVAEHGLTYEEARRHVRAALDDAA
ncbi:Clp protease N-terminal domain-containing protein [Nocardiopsis sp. NPDC050513]|uniref:Clp protease N-terminal domain-containing protein n=1 Tax=Nocardiopsis sp. NPDC050513 TaxID=3364338 RepID=UPI00379641EC